MYILKYLFTGVACGFMGVVLVFLLVPLWRIIEAQTGVEMIGHSGPASWLIILCMCFCAGMGVTVLAYKGRAEP